MRGLFLVALVSVAAEAQEPRARFFDRICSRTPGGRSTRGLGCDTGAFFEFAPASGTGMGTACACAAVTGTRGETITAARASTALCLRQGLAATGIADGDVVSCAINTPRVELAADLVPSLLLEPVRTNTLLRSQELDNVAWVATGTGVAAPTVTANFATAPDGTTTAERLQVAACAGAGNVSAVVQSYTGTAAAWSAHTFIRGNGTSGTLTIALNDTTATAGTAISVAFDSSGWTWLGAPTSPLTRTFANTTHQVLIGCVNVASISGSANTGAADVLVWQAQSEAGSTPSSPIPTTTAAVTRAQELMSVSFSTPPTGATAATGFCMAATSRCFGPSPRALGAYSTTGGSTLILDLVYPTGGNAETLWFRGASTSFTSTLALDTTQRRWLTSAGAASSAFRICRDATCQTGGSRGVDASGNTSAALFMGSYISGSQCNGLINRVQFDSDPSRCTP